MFQGYIGRIMHWDNPWSSIGLKIQVSTLIMAPAFMAAAIYVTLKSIVRNLTPESSVMAHLSPLRPVVYTPLFMAGDALCGILQAIGGGIAAAAGTNVSQLAVGSDVMLAGIVAQVAVSFVVFIALAGTYAVRVYRQRSQLEEPARKLLRSARFRIFILSLAFSFSLIFIRCIYRIAAM